MDSVWRRSWCAVLAVLGVLVLVGCTSRALDALEDAHPELTDLQLDNAERVDRLTSSSDSQAFPTGNSINQHYVPLNDGISKDDVVLKAVEAAEALGWTMTYSGRSGAWNGCQPAAAPKTGYKLRISIYDVEANPTLPDVVSVRTTVGRPC